MLAYNHWKTRVWFLSFWFESAFLSFLSWFRKHNSNDLNSILSHTNFFKLFSNFLLTLPSKFWSRYVMRLKTSGMILLKRYRCDKVGFNFSKSGQNNIENPKNCHIAPYRQTTPLLKTLSLGLWWALIFFFLWNF